MIEKVVNKFHFWINLEMTHIMVFFYKLKFSVRCDI